MAPSDTPKPIQNQAVQANDGAVPLQALQNTQPGVSQGMGKISILSQYNQAKTLTTKQTPKSPTTRTSNSGAVTAAVAAPDGSASAFRAHFRAISVSFRW